MSVPASEDFSSTESCSGWAFGFPLAVIGVCVVIGLLGWFATNLLPDLTKLFYKKLTVVLKHGFVRLLLALLAFLPFIDVIKDIDVLVSSASNGWWKIVAFLLLFLLLSLRISFLFSITNIPISRSWEGFRMFVFLYFPGLTVFCLQKVSVDEQHTTTNHEEITAEFHVHPISWCKQTMLQIAESMSVPSVLAMEVALLLLGPVAGIIRLLIACYYLFRAELAPDAKGFVKIKSVAKQAMFIEQIVEALPQAFVQAIAHSITCENRIMFSVSILLSLYGVCKGMYSYVTLNAVEIEVVNANDLWTSLCDSMEGNTPAHVATLEKLVWWDLREDSEMEVLARACTANKLPKLKTIVLHKFAIEDDTNDLNLKSKRLKDADMKIISNCIGNGALPSLWRLVLYDNEIGDEGMKALAAAVRSGALGLCTLINLNSNNIGDVGMQAFSDAISSGALANLEDLGLSDNRIGDAGMSAFAEAVRSGALAKLKVLSLDGNQIGDAGMVEFSRQIASGVLANSTHLYLSNNNISDPGMVSLSDAIASGALANLRDVYLGGSNISDSVKATMKTAAEARSISVYF